MRLIDADALKKDLSELNYDMALRIVDIQPTIEPEVRIIPKEVSATDVDKLTEMIKDCLLQAYPNGAMFTAVRHGRWENIPGMNNTVFCSECLAAANKELAMKYKGCPFCLARMDGGADND